MTERSDHPVQRLAAVLAPELMRSAERLLAANAVLEVARPSRRAVVARVANELGRFEQVRLSFGKGGLTPVCSCGRGRAPCAHVVAVLLDLAGRGGDECGEWDWVPLLAALGKGGAVRARTTQAHGGHGGHGPASDAEPLATPAEAAAVPPPDAGTGEAAPGRRRSLRELPGLPGTGARDGDAPVLTLSLPSPLPLLDSRWATLPVRAELTCRGRPYGLANVRRLVESGRAAGGMVWEGCSPQTQQLMRLLVSAGDEDATGFTLAAHDAAVLVDLLAGYPWARLGSAPLVVHPEPAEAVLVLLGTDGASCRVRPGFLVPRAPAGDGAAPAERAWLLPPGQVSGVAGRGVNWVAVGEHVWRAPGTLDAGWFRVFARGVSEVLPAAELARWAAAGRAPVRVVAADRVAELGITAGVCEPVLTLDWRRREVSATLTFDYGCACVTGDGPELLPSAAGFARRDRDTEDAARREVRQHGFHETPEAGPDRLVLANPDLLWDFWRQGYDELSTHCRILVSQAFLKARGTAGLIRLEVAAAGEAADWFELSMRFQTEQGTCVEWEEVVRAVLAGRQTVLAGEDVLIHIPEHVRTLVLRLQEEAQGVHGGRARFSVCSAVVARQSLGPLAAGLKANWLRLAEALASPPPAALTGVPAELGHALRGYQREGVGWLMLLESCGFHGILADEMGLGKTVQALAVLARRKALGLAEGPALVVCPSSLLENWRNEASRFAPSLSTLLVRGLHRAEALQRLREVDLIITSYALLRRDVARYRAVRMDYVILDEAQHIKNPRTVNAQSCKELDAAHRLILTGTPLENALHEVWSLFDFLLPGYLGGRQEFQRRYEIPGDEGEAARARLAARLRPFVLRRRKADVCQELPPKQEQLLHCEMDERQARLYATFLAAGRELLRGAGDRDWRGRRFQVLALLMRLRQICCHPALLPATLRESFGAAPPSAKTELLEEVVLEAIDSGRRMVLFSQFTSFLRLFRAWLEREGIRYEYLDGATPGPERQPRVDRFNGDAGIPLFLISLRAGGTGLNLVGADTVIHYDQWWNPMVEDQATDRTHRIGQRKTVTVIKLVVAGSVEDKILQLQARKRLLFDQVMSGVPARPGELSREDVEFLLG